MALQLRKDVKIYVQEGCPYQVNEDNYYKPETNIHFMSVSLFKKFQECPAKAVAYAKGEYVQETTEAMLQGSYVDAYFSGEGHSFKAKHPELFNSRTGELLAKYVLCNKVIQSIINDRQFYERYYVGVTQIILVFQFAGAWWKAKLDFIHVDNDYKPISISDMKCMKSIDSVWSDSAHRYVPWWFAYRYDIQGALYQKGVEILFGVKVPYDLTVATKEEPCKHKVYHLSDELLATALEEVERETPRYWAMLQGKEEPTECGHCDYYWKKYKFDPAFDVEEIGPDDRYL